MTGKLITPSRVRPSWTGLSWISLALIIFTCSGCDRIFGEQPAKVIIEVEASKELNPDSNGRPSPVVVRLYQLKSADAFNSALFDDLYYDGDEILGADLITVREINVFPGTKELLPKEDTALDAQYLGILAAYRDIDNAIWREAVATPNNKTVNIHLTLGQISIKAQTSK